MHKSLRIHEVVHRLVRMIPDWTIGDRLAKARRYADLTVIEMAERLDVHRNSVGAWESDRHRPRRRDVLAWSHITGVPVDWILEGRESATSQYVTRSDLALAA
jgi:transcriptional regulator with XRE-family HTH domain